MRACLSNGLPIPVAIRATTSSARPWTTLLLSAMRSLRAVARSARKRSVREGKQRSSSKKNLQRLLGLSRLLASRIAWMFSRASLRVFQFASLHAVAFADETSLSRSTRGKSSSRASSSVALPLPPFPPAAGAAATAVSTAVRVGAGGESAATLSNSDSIVVRRAGLRSWRKEEMPAMRRSQAR